ncbi:MAG: hypothetical protein JWQ98_1821 [Chlorobi bacterium]|nr:hypothetical protein [Chlorobiota bacterium]
MHRRNGFILLGVLGLIAVAMSVVHIVVFPRQGYFGISGLGITAVALMFLNRRWLHPSAPTLPRMMMVRSLLVGGLLGISFTLFFGALMAAG